MFSVHGHKFLIFWRKSVCLSDYRRCLCSYENNVFFIICWLGRGKKALLALKLGKCSIIFPGLPSLRPGLQETLAAFSDGVVDSMERLDIMAKLI